MDKKLFQETFSAVHASNAVISEVLEMTRERKTNGCGALRKILIAAVAVMLIATTVFAASAIHNALVGV